MTYSEHNRTEREKESPYDFCYFVLNDERSRLYERFLWDELMCTSKEEHEALFGDAGDFDEDDDDEDDIDFDDCDMDDDF